MAISDIYLVQNLLQATKAIPRQIAWHEKDSGGYISEIKGVRLDLGLAYSTCGSQVYLVLSRRLDKVSIEEPLTIGFLRPAYRSEDHRRLAELMKELASAVARQCSFRTAEAVQEIERTRESIYRQLLFGQAPAALSDASGRETAEHS